MFLYFGDYKKGCKTLIINFYRGYRVTYIRTFVFIYIRLIINVHVSVRVYAHTYFADVGVNQPIFKSANKKAML